MNAPSPDIGHGSDSGGPSNGCGSSTSHPHSWPLMLYKASYRFVLLYFVNVTLINMVGELRVCNLVLPAHNHYRPVKKREEEMQANYLTSAYYLSQMTLTESRRIEFWYKTSVARHLHAPCKFPRSWVFSLKLMFCVADSWHLGGEPHPRLSCTFDRSACSVTAAEAAILHILSL